MKRYKLYRGSMHEDEKGKYCLFDDVKKELEKMEDVLASAGAIILTLRLRQDNPEVGEWVKEIVNYLNELQRQDDLRLR